MLKNIIYSIFALIFAIFENQGENSNMYNEKLFQDRQINEKNF